MKNRAFGSSILVFTGMAGVCAGVLDVNHRELVSRADLAYTRAVESSEHGLPIGNGRMGTLVWTSPYALQLQINRVDVFANNSATDSFPARHTDYCGGAGFVDIEFPEYGAEIFRRDDTSQHLSCYEGLATVRGSGITIQALAWHERDVMAVQVEDRRERPGTIAVNLRMLRASTVRTASHTATSKLASRDGRIILTQAFAEGDYFCGSAVAVGVIGRDAEVRTSHAGELRLVVEPGPGAFTVLISSAATFDPKHDLTASVLPLLEAAAAENFAGLREANRAWWRDFWARSFIHLGSRDGVAEQIEQYYTYFLYLMASSSRGAFPTKFNGMLWTTGGDRRQWGAQYWGANQSCLYNNALFAANQIELTDPMFDMLSGMAEACALAARQQWGSQGIFYPETVMFDGLAPLPEDIAAEMRALYLLQQPWETVSARFRDFAGTKQPHSSRWNWMGGGDWANGRWVPQERDHGPYGPVTHIFSRGAKYAYQYWVRYEYTQDEAWLRDRAYPILKGVAEFYRHYPNLAKGDDGKYHIHRVNSNESIWGSRDSDEEIASMRGIFPVLLKASDILGLDVEMRPVWQEFLDNLAPLPRSDHPDAQPARTPYLEPVWIRGLNPVLRGIGSGRPDGNTMPMWFFDLCTMESDAETQKIGGATLDAYFPSGVGSGRRVGVLSKLPLVAAIMGRADAVRTLVPAQFNTNERGTVLANRMDQREGAQTTSAQRLGNASDALHTALCHDLPAGPGQPPVIRVFAAWPAEWDADFTLLCRGGFLVTSAMRDGVIEFVELESRFGGECRLRNPWGEQQATIHRDGKIAGNVSGPLFKLRTRQGERIVVVRTGTTPGQFTRTVPEQGGR